MASSKSGQTICLNMIVKNEAHIIAASLEKLCAKVKFDYWVISDTGSTDETKVIIKSFFKAKNIPGKLHNDEWKDFGHNRSVALEHAFGKTDYLLIFDADDEIHGNFALPDKLDHDAYKLTFGNAHTYTYERPLLVNNKKKWKFIGVLHEFLAACEQNTTMASLIGDYSVISGRTGSRSADPDKYLKDAKVLEKAYNEAVATNGPLQDRYAFYCANSYFDCAKYAEASEWYKKTLTHNGWDQEKYISCFKLYKCYKRLNRIEYAHFYLVKSNYYDKERLECVFKLIVHYCVENQFNIAYSYYSLIQTFYESKYLQANFCDKLFVDNRIGNFFLPYYMIIISDKVKMPLIGVKMFEIIFIKKTEAVNEFHVGCLLFNLQFFTETVKMIDNSVPNYSTQFFMLVDSYLAFLVARGYNLQKHEETLKKYSKFNLPTINKLFSLTPNASEELLIKPAATFQVDECKNSKNVLFFTGFCNLQWNYTYGLTNALGGSERAVAYLSSFFPKDCNIYVSGNVKEETINNITYVNLQKLPELIKTTAFHTIIVSRYVGFYEMYPFFSAYQTFIWIHDTTLINYGCALSVPQILTKWSPQITGAICLTEWHKNHISNEFPVLKDKISIINNGIVPTFLANDIPVQKIKNSFIYTSCSERGLKKLLEVWPEILKTFPDATLKISSYNNFPQNEYDVPLKKMVDNYPSSITHLGALKPSQLYELMRSSEYWLYTSYWPETSCITALEMLASGVICIYYPIAGLTNTMDKYGIQIKEGEEMSALNRVNNWSKEEKEAVIASGKQYVFNSCSWEHRAASWSQLLFPKILLEDKIYQGLKYDQDIKYETIDEFYEPQTQISLNTPENKITMVTAFLDIGRSDWVAHGRRTKDYVNSFLNYLNVDYTMIVFIDDRYIDVLLAAYEKSKYKNKTFIPINKEWLQTHIYAWQQLSTDNAIINSQQYKKTVAQGLSKDLHLPENTCSEYNIVNHSKIDLINYVIDNKLTTNDFICWCDFGYHFSILLSTHSRYPVNVLDASRLNPDKITICTKQKITSVHADPIYVLQKTPEIIVGCFFGGPVKMLKDFQNVYHESLQEFYANGICDDDQHIYLRCVLKQPSMFHMCLRPQISTNSYTMNNPNALRYFQSTTAIENK